MNLTRSIGNRDLSHIYATDLSCHMTVDNVKQLVGKCRRQVWYQKVGVEPTNPSDVSGIKKMESGNIYEDWFINLVKEVGDYIGEQVRVFIPEHNISGRIDLVTRDPQTGMLMGWEIKSTGSYYVTKQCIKADDAFPKLEHIMQIIPYMVKKKEHVKLWKILYIDRGSVEWKPHNIIMIDDEKLKVNNKIIEFSLNEIYERADHITECIESGEAPDRDYMLEYTIERARELSNDGLLNKTNTKKLQKGKIDFGDWQCAYCDYKDECYGDE